MIKLPEYLKKYFWEIDFNKLDSKKSSYYIIERLLEYGDKEAIQWLTKNFSKQALENVVYTSKQLSKKSANFWQLIFNLDRNKILCFKKSFQKKHRAIWSS
jgi:succinate dehydrogenase flavin-adding protein (antitoxin of CptAB toxin-antitoxin module)